MLKKEKLYLCSECNQGVVKVYHSVKNGVSEVGVTDCNQCDHPFGFTSVQKCQPISRDPKIKIEKGDAFLCVKSLHRGTELLYTEGRFYKSRLQNSLVANSGSNYFGFNANVIEDHFIKV